MYSVRVDDKEVLVDAKEFTNGIFKDNFYGLISLDDALPRDYGSMVSWFCYRFNNDESFKSFVKAVEHEWNGLILLGCEMAAFMYGIYGMRIPAKAETEI